MLRRIICILLLHMSLYTQAQLIYPFIENERWGLVSSDGHIISDAQYDYIHEPTQRGNYIVRKNRKFGIINGRGDLIIDLDYDYMKETNHDYLVIKQDQRYGLMNIDLEIILPPTYLYVGLFSLGHALILNEKGYSFIDSTLQVAYDIKADYVHSSYPYDHIQCYEKDDLHGFVNLKTKNVYPPISTHPIEFTDHTAYIITPNSAFYIDERGRQVKNQEELDRLKKMKTENKYHVNKKSYGISRTISLNQFEKDGKKGILKSNGDVLISAKYDFFYTIMDSSSMHRYYLAGSKIKNQLAGSKYDLYSDNGTLLLSNKKGNIEFDFITSGFIHVKDINAGTVYHLDDLNQKIIDYDSCYMILWRPTDLAPEELISYQINRDGKWYVYDRNYQLIYTKN